MMLGLAIDGCGAFWACRVCSRDLVSPVWVLWLYVVVVLGICQCQRLMCAHWCVNFCEGVINSICFCCPCHLSVWLDTMLKVCQHRYQVDCCNVVCCHVWGTHNLLWVRMCHTGEEIW